MDDLLKKTTEASIQTMNEMEQITNENELLKMKLFDKEVEIMQLNENNSELKSALRDALKENEMVSISLCFFKSMVNSQIQSDSRALSVRTAL